MRAAARRLRGVPEPRPWRPGDAPVRPADGLAVLEIGPPRRCRAEAWERRASRARRRPIVILWKGRGWRWRGEADALVTAPINKEWLNRAGHRFPGHSELLAELSRTRLWRMMFAGDQLRLALVTVHMGLARVSRALSSQGVFDTIRLLAQHLSARPGSSPAARRRARIQPACGREWPVRRRRGAGDRPGHPPRAARPASTRTDRSRPTPRSSGRRESSASMRRSRCIMTRG